MGAIGRMDKRARSCLERVPSYGTVFDTKAVETAWTLYEIERGHALAAATDSSVCVRETTGLHDVRFGSLAW